MDERGFLGRGLKFPLQVDPRTGKIAMSEYEEDIRESVEILLRTNQGERVMRPEFGSDTLEYVFAPGPGSMANTIAHHLQEVLLEQEPRIRDVEIQTQGSDRQTGAMVISVSYTVRSTNNRYNHVYPFYVTEGSEGGGAE